VQGTKRKPKSISAHISKKIGIPPWQSWSRTSLYSHWKADHVLGNTLLVKVAEHSEDNQSDPNEQTGGSRRSESKKRAGKHRSGDKKRRKKGTGKTASPDKEEDGGKSDAMSTGKPFNYIYGVGDSLVYSVPTPSNAPEQPKAQMPSSSFMQGVNAPTQSVAVDVSFIQVDTSCMSYSLRFTV
jgi:hypothetical protein